MDVAGTDSDWRSPLFRRKVIVQIEEAMRKARTLHAKSSSDMEHHIYIKAKSREEYLSLVARLIIHFRDIHKKTLGGPDPMNALTNLTGVGGGPGAIGMGPRPTGAPVGGMGAMGQMQIGQHAMAGVAGNPQAIGGPGQMPMQQMVQAQQQQQSIQFQQQQSAMQQQQQQSAMQQQQQQNAAIQQLLRVQQQNQNQHLQQNQQDGGLNVLPQDVPLNSSSHVFPSASAGGSESPRRASLHRLKVVEDLVSVFMDSSVMAVTLQMDFVNEDAADDAAVQREVYTAFWEQLLEQCEGETERVLQLRPGFCEAEWRAVGRIWAKGFLDHGVLPVRLSKAFVVACIHGVDSVDADVLMTSFLSYLPPVERAAVEKALRGTEEEIDGDLFDFLTRMGSRFLPPPDKMAPVIQTMAHKAILQEPKYIIDCFSTAMARVRPTLPDKQSVLSLYESKRATGSRVWRLFETTQAELSQREQNTFDHLQRYVKNADQSKAEKILRFCTGASVVCVDRIAVSFNGDGGLGRRPVARLCGAALHLPSTYGSYPEFRSEFDNILSSNFLELES